MCIGCLIVHPASLEGGPIPPGSDDGSGGRIGRIGIRTVPNLLTVSKVQRSRCASVEIIKEEPGLRPRAQEEARGIVAYIGIVHIVITGGRVADKLCEEAFPSILTSSVRRTVCRSVAIV